VQPILCGLAKNLTQLCGKIAAKTTEEAVRTCSLEVNAIKVVNDIKEVHDIKALPHALTGEQEARRRFPRSRIITISQKRVYSDQLICLFALTVMAVWRYGARAGIVAGIALFTAAADSRGAGL
jgi:hypothetical protein